MNTARPREALTCSGFAAFTISRILPISFSLSSGVLLSDPQLVAMTDCTPGCEVVDRVELTDGRTFAVVGTFIPTLNPLGGQPQYAARVYLLVRGCIAIFSLVAADHKLYKILTFGLVPPGGSPLEIACVVLWILLMAGGAALVVRRSGSGAARFVTLWFAAHMLTLSAATPIVSRHFYLGALPACLLTAWILWRGAAAAAAWIGRQGALAALRMPEPQAAAVLAFLVVLLLAVNAKTDLDTAGTVHKEATLASRHTPTTS